ncbi:MAG: hypothetical protein FWG43_03745 [Clostridiales bacterium]|nr:hypothetical protein [Clostridiales bacterium]
MSYTTPSGVAPRPGIIKNCVALNSDVKSIGSASRIVGYSAPEISPSHIVELTRNYALSSMMVTIADKNKNPLKIGHNQVDAADVSILISKIKSFWTYTMGWDTEIWDIEEGRWPLPSS